VSGESMMLRWVSALLKPPQRRGRGKKFGGPIEVMPGEPRAGITEDVLAEIGYRGFSMREHMVTVAQKRVRDRAG
jgi:hypothetical protein